MGSMNDMDLDADTIDLLEYLQSKHRLSDDDTRSVLLVAKTVANVRQHKTITMEDLLLASWEEPTVAKHWWQYAKDKVHWNEEEESPIILDSIIDDIETTLDTLRDFKLKGGLRIRNSAWWQLLACSVSIADALQDAKPVINP